MDSQKNSYINPYVGGVLLGVLLLFAYAYLGTGIGASGGIARIAAATESLVAKEHVINSEYFGNWGEDPLAYYLVFMLLGTLIGGAISAVLAKRLRPGLEKGARFPTKMRILYALSGGVLVGFASRIARGCTSGQALSGGALLLTGSLLFVVFLFLTGYALARLFREQWYD